MRKMRCVWLFGMIFWSLGVWAQAPSEPISVKALGTRSWIRINWKSASDNADGYRLYWSTSASKPRTANVTVGPDQTRYYIEGVDANVKYWAWVEAYNQSGSSKAVPVEVTTETAWKLLPEETKELETNPSSRAVPEGMELAWHDEFNDLLLNRNKWSANYYSNIDHLRGEFEADMRNDNLAQPAYILNGETINLYVSDSLPTRVYDQKNDKKISSIQTYDWRTNENLLDNSRGGYFEVKVKRTSTGKPRGLNTAFWFDAPGPDLSNYLQEGTERNGVKGIRPKGQVFEIDVFEYITAQFVLHGHVDKNGQFQRNLNTHIAKGYTHFDTWVTHGILWSPTRIEHYINGDLIHVYDDKHNMYSPNHFMNVLLGSYGGGGTVNMEVDYIRMYQWPLEGTNELPNPGFESNDTRMPWEGTGELVHGEGMENSQAIGLERGQFIEQYVYVENDQDYSLTYHLRGSGMLEGSVDNVTLVTGELDPIVKMKDEAGETFTKQQVGFRSGKEHRDYKKKIRIYFKNIGKGKIWLDSLSLTRVHP